MSLVNGRFLTGPSSLRPVCSKLTTITFATCIFRQSATIPNSSLPHKRSQPTFICSSLCSVAARFRSSSTASVQPRQSDIDHEDRPIQCASATRRRAGAQTDVDVARQFVRVRQKETSKRRRPKTKSFHQFLFL